MRYRLRTLLILLAVGPPLIAWWSTTTYLSGPRAPIGMDGYCPVTLNKSNRWTVGHTRFSALYDGRTYLFAGLDEQAAFVRERSRYAPKLHGNDCVRWVDEGRESVGKCKHRLIHIGRIYLFDSEETLGRFAANP